MNDEDPLNSLGNKLAREGRIKANKLTPAEREAARKFAYKIIEESNKSNNNLKANNESDNNFKVKNESDDLPLCWMFVVLIIILAFSL